MAKCWNAFTHAESDEYFDLVKRIGAWVAYAEMMRARQMEPDSSFNLSDAEYMRWNELSWKFWK